MQNSNQKFQHKRNPNKTTFKELNLESKRLQKEPPKTQKTKSLLTQNLNQAKKKKENNFKATLETKKRIRKIENPKKVNFNKKRGKGLTFYQLPSWFETSC